MLFINNLFSVFDPKSWMSLPLNWIAITMLFMFLPVKLLNKPDFSLSAFKLMMDFLKKEFSLTLGKGAFPGVLVIPVMFFVLIGFNNFFGLLPYVFTASSHMSATMALALPLCSGMILLEVFVSPKNFMVRLVPTGSPVPLSPALVMLELVSALIRPLTLSIRLAANMTAGHLLLVLVSSMMPYSHLMVTLILVLPLTLLMVLEVSVSLIQAYVFSALNISYTAEVNSMYKL